MIYTLSSHHLRTLCFAVSWLSILPSLTAQHTIPLDPVHTHYHGDSSWLLYNQHPLILPDDLTDTATTVALSDGLWEADKAVALWELGDLIALVRDGNTRLLWLTDLPVVLLHADAPIPDEPRVPGSIHIVYPDGEQLWSRIGVERKGASTIHLPKRSYRIEAWADSLGTHTHDLTPQGMRTDDDWDLLGVPGEPLRLRTHVVNSVWRDLAVPHYLADEPEARHYRRMEYVEAFVNGEYRGIYQLAERLDRKQLQLQKPDDGAVRGILYKMTQHQSYTAVDEADVSTIGVEYRYPDGTPEWSPLLDFYSFVSNSSDATFHAEAGQRFDMDNAVDYFLMLNLFRLIDNETKNLYIARYDDDTPLFYVPFDFDASIGRSWNGTDLPTTTDTLTNPFYQRLAESCADGAFLEQVWLRWTELRHGDWRHHKLMERVTPLYSRLLHNGAYQRETWAQWDFNYDTTQVAYMSDWLHHRLLYLDSFYLAQCDFILPTQAPLPVPDVSVYPNPARAQLTLVTPMPGRYRLYDYTGQLVQSGEVQAPYATLDVSKLPRGWYVVHLLTEQGSIVKRVLLE